MAKKKKSPGNFAAQNRKARHNYHILERFEAGLVLTGTEVKSLRLGRATISEAYAGEKGGELYLLDAHIPEYKAASGRNHEPKRPRKLLLRKSELRKLAGAVQRKGMTLVAMSIYFNARGIAKVELGLGQGKHTYDKRAASKERDWKRDKARVMRARG